MKKILLVVLLAGIVIPHDGLAQGLWSFGGQVRHRYEMDNKDFNSDTNFDNFSLLRSRFNALYRHSDNVEAFFQLQDSRTFGEETSTLDDGSADNIDFHQVYVRINNLFDYPVDVKLGRMEAIYGNERLLGAVGWHNVARSFDGFIFSIRGKSFVVDIFNFKEIEARQAGENLDRNLYGVYGIVNNSDSYSIQPYILYQRQQPTRVLNRITFGTYVDGTSGNFSYKTEIAFQTGDRFDRDVNAYLTSAALRYTHPQLSYSPVLTGGVDIVSGDSNLLDNNYRIFDTMYATNHKFYGFMDYFLNIPDNTLGMGLNDLYAGLELHPLDRLNIAAVGHLMLSNKDYQLLSGSASNSFGSEIDITLRHAYDETVSVVGGLSFFLPGDIFKEVRGDDASTWLYLMTTVNLR
ncbi:alginate export family protein [candidate division KSB1 bacterium]